MLLPRTEFLVFAARLECPQEPATVLLKALCVVGVSALAARLDAFSDLLAANTESPTLLPVLAARIPF